MSNPGIYDDLDGAILATVQSGKTTFSQILPAVKAKATPVAPKSRWGDDGAWRLVDRRLQALRKDGKLSYTRGAGWRVEAGVKVTR